MSALHNTEFRLFLEGWFRDHPWEGNDAFPAALFAACWADEARGYEQDEMAIANLRVMVAEIYRLMHDINDHIAASGRLTEPYRDVPYSAF